MTKISRDAISTIKSTCICKNSFRKGRSFLKGVLCIIYKCVAKRGGDRGAEVEVEGTEMEVEEDI